MMTSLQQHLIREFTERIFESETRQHKARINRLIETNNDRLGRRAPGFLYLESGYGPDGRPAFNVPLLVEDLHPEMKRLLDFKKVIDLDRQLVTQTLVKLIQPSPEIQDIRDALPECVVALHNWLKEHSRTREPAWNIRDNPRDLRQYEKALPKIETYCAMRLLY